MSTTVISESKLFLVKLNIWVLGGSIKKRWDKNNAELPKVVNASCTTESLNE